MSSKDLPNESERAKTREDWVKKGLTPEQAWRVERLQYNACVRNSVPQWNKAINWAFDRIDERKRVAA